ncbi:MAG: permease, partial [Synergistaceae bacterium]|nr:permease [Synergistaceae bacterium]
ALIGEKSGLLGAGLSIFLGAFAAGPLYLAFPIAETLLRKGTGLFNVFLFVGAWSTMKIPMLMFEMQSLGLKFAFVRYAMSALGIFWIAWAVEKALGEKGQRELSRRYRP